MSQDSIERDRILSEVHADVKHIMKWTQDHEERDNVRFEKIEKGMVWQNKILYGLVGVYVFVQFIASVKN